MSGWPPLHQQPFEIRAASATAGRRARVFGDLCHGRQCAVADRVDDLAARDALAVADVDRRVCVVRLRARSAAGAEPVEELAGHLFAVGQQGSQLLRVAQVAEQDRARETAVGADQQPAVVAAAGVEREQFVVAILVLDAPAAEQVDSGDLERRRGRAAEECGGPTGERGAERARRFVPAAGSRGRRFVLRARRTRRRRGCPACWCAVRRRP